MDDHVEKSARLSRKYLEELELSDEKIAKIQTIITEHSLDSIYTEVIKGKISAEEAINTVKNKKFSLREAEILYDADKIDFLGASGIYRTISRWNEEGWPLDILPKIYAMCAKLIMNTLHDDKMKEIAKPRYDLTIKFCKELQKDLNGGHSEKGNTRPHGRI